VQVQVQVHDLLKEHGFAQGAWFAQMGIEHGILNMGF
jgi:hypothetical protein